MDRIKFSPDYDRILILRDADREQTETGILIPVQSRAMYSGVIQRVGPESKKKEGDHVSFGKYAGTPITIAGKDYLIMRDGDIFGNIE